MGVVNQEISKNCNIYLHGDTHLGSMAASMHSIQAMIEDIKKDKNAYWIHMGDWIEAIAVDDKRFAYEGTKVYPPLKQVEEVIELYKPIASKGLLGLTGNHELALSKMGDLGKLICKGLSIPYGYYSCVLQCKINKKLAFKMLLTHGYGTIRSNSKDKIQQRANQLANLKRKLEEKAADCLIMAMGHTHQLLKQDPIEDILQITSNDTKLEQSYLEKNKGTDKYMREYSRWYVNTGSFLKTYVPGIITYSEKAGYNPVTLGYAIVEVRNGEVENVKLKKIM